MTLRSILRFVAGLTQGTPLRNTTSLKKAIATRLPRAFDKLRKPRAGVYHKTNPQKQSFNRFRKRGSLPASGSSAAEGST
ncbi:hypothetical protein [Methylocella silvestris]|nr:hypothetical protein [Methylocella silvestris]